MKTTEGKFRGEREKPQKSFCITIGYMKEMLDLEE